MWFDDEEEKTDAPVNEPGEYELGDDIGEKIGEGNSTDDLAL